MKARLLFKQKYVYPDGAVIEMKAWSVPKTAGMREGFKYSLAYIDREGNRALGYDNAEGKGHHRHKGRQQEPFEFQSVEALVKIFLKEVQKMREGQL